MKNATKWKKKLEKSASMQQRENPDKFVVWSELARTALGSFFFPDISMGIQLPKWSAPGKFHEHPRFLLNKRCDARTERFLLAICALGKWINVSLYFENKIACYAAEMDSPNEKCAKQNAGRRWPRGRRLLDEVNDVLRRTGVRQCLGCCELGTSTANSVRASRKNWRAQSRLYRNRCWQPMAHFSGVLRSTRCSLCCTASNPMCC